MHTYHSIPRQYAMVQPNEPTIKREHDLNTFLYSNPPDFTPGDMNHPTHPDHRYPPLPSDSNTIRMSPSRLGTSEQSQTDFRYQIPAPQPQHLLRHQHQNHVLNHIHGGPTFFPPSMAYDQEHTAGHLDRHPHVGMVYDSLHEPMSVSAQAVRRDPTLNHRGSLASLNSNHSGSGSYHTTNLPVSSIPMSNNRGTLNTSMPAVHSSSFSMGPSSSRWPGHPSAFDMAGSTAAVHGQVPATPSSSLRPILRHSESDSRSSPESSFAQDAFHLRPSTSEQTLASSHSTHSPSPRLSDNESNIGGQRYGSELFSQDDRESDQDVEKVVLLSESSSTGRKEVIRTGEEVGEISAPAKKKKKSKMHCCEICFKKFPRPSGLKTHMNTHSNEKPFPCGFPGCNRSFGVRSNAKRHLRTHGVIPTPTVNPNSADAPYVVGFCPPMVGVPQLSQSQLHPLEGGEDVGDNNGNIPTQDSQGPSDMQHEMRSVPMLKLRWMPPSLSTRTNAESLREVRDRQQMHWIGDVDGEDEDDFAGGSGTTRMGSGGNDMDMDMERDDKVDGDEVGENDPSLSIPLRRPVIPSSSTRAVAASSTGIRLMVSRPAECMRSPLCSTQGTCRLSSPRTFASMSPVSSTSFAGSISPSSMAAYRQHEIDLTSGGVYTPRTENVSREYGVREARTEERNSEYLETGSHPYHHPSQFRVLPGPTVALNPIPLATVRL